MTGLKEPGSQEHSSSRNTPSTDQAWKENCTTHYLVSNKFQKFTALQLSQKPRLANKGVSMLLLEYKLNNSKGS